MRLFIKSTYFLLAIIVVIGQDDFGTENGAAEYQNIFKNIPTLFEYMLETLEEKPQVLEKNDANVFRADEDDDKHDELVRFQRSAIKDSNRVKDGPHGTVSYINGDRRNNNQPNEGKTIEASHNQDVNTHTKDDTKYHNIENDKIETSRKESVKTFEISEDGHKRKAAKRTINKNSNTNSDEEEDNGKEVGSFAGNNEKDTTWSLTPEEVAQQALRVEEILEQHNSSKK